MKTLAEHLNADTAPAHDAQAFLCGDPAHAPLASAPPSVASVEASVRTEPPNRTPFGGLTEPPSVASVQGTEPPSVASVHAADWGRIGGRKSRAALTPEQRLASSRKANEAKRLKRMKSKIGFGNPSSDTDVFG